jgi:hypothetical protein
MWRWILTQAGDAQLCGHILRLANNDKWRDTGFIKFFVYPQKLANQSFANMLYGSLEDLKIKKELCHDTIGFTMRVWTRCCTV